MHPWDSSPHNPQNLTLVADARLSPPDYVNDQIWELSIGNSEPPTICLQTTFGLRALGIRLFPHFTCGAHALSHPGQFHTPPRLVACYPNYLALACAPFEGVEANLEYWVPDSQTVTGQIHIHNNGPEAKNLLFEWCVVLNPLETGERMAPAQIRRTLVLQGKTGDLSPVCFVTGGPQAGSGIFPSLSHPISLQPGESRSFQWALATLSNPEDSFERARQAAQRPWAAEITHIEMLNQSQQLEFHTGNPAWDTALALAQRTAFSLLFQCNQSAQMSFVLGRQPDQGFSFRGDGSDYGYPWSGQTALDTYYLNSLLLPGGAELAKGLLLHLLESQDKTGFIDLKPGLAGQRCHCLAQPLLATIALQIDAHLTDSAWLAEIYPRLLRFFEIWFQPNHDRDQDGFPEWEHPLQTGLQDGTIYDRWHPASQGVAIGCLESPALGALLYRECHSLMQIGQRLHNEENLPALQEKAHTLKQAVESTWDAKTASYHYRDAQSHQSSQGASLLQFAGSGKKACNRRFRRPQRLQIILSAHDSHTRPVTMTIVGQGEAGELREHITPNRFSWYHGQACYTTQALFQSVAHVEVQGFGKADQGSLKRIDYTQEDISLLLPLWAQIPSPRRAQTLIEKTLRPRYLGLNGLVAFPLTPEPAETAGPNPVHMLWNHLLGEALLAYGYHALAADLFTRLMNAILPALQQEGAFRETYPGGHGRRGGAHNSLHGLPPLGLLLPLLGIHRLGPRGFFLQGIIPFTGTSTVKYQGIAITRQAQDSGVRLSTGETIQLSTSGSHRIRIR